MPPPARLSISSFIILKSLCMSEKGICPNPVIDVCDQALLRESISGFEVMDYAVDDKVGWLSPEFFVGKPEAGVKPLWELGLAMFVELSIIQEIGVEKQ